MAVKKKADAPVATASAHDESVLCDVCVNPMQLAHSLRGRIWQKLIARADLAAYKERLPVISSRLAAGKTLVRVYGESAPELDFEPVDPDLEDLYFWSVTRPEIRAEPGPLVAAGAES